MVFAVFGKVEDGIREVGIQGQFDRRALLDEVGPSAGDERRRVVSRPEADGNIADFGRFVVDELERADAVLFVDAVEKGKDGLALVKLDVYVARGRGDRVEGKLRRNAGGDSRVHRFLDTVVAAVTESAGEDKGGRKTETGIGTHFPPGILEGASVVDDFVEAGDTPELDFNPGSRIEKNARTEAAVDELGCRSGIEERNVEVAEFGTDVHKMEQFEIGIQCGAAADRIIGGRCRTERQAHFGGDADIEIERKTVACAENQGTIEQHHFQS